MYLARLVIHSNTVRLACSFAVTIQFFSIPLFLSVHWYMVIIMVGKFMNKSVLLIVQCEFRGLGYKNK